MVLNRPEFKVADLWIFGGKSPFSKFRTQSGDLKGDICNIQLIRLQEKHVLLLYVQN